jgi:3'(2'), 5'-bisphosphate nucleotidase
VNIALINESAPILGIVYSPVLQSLYVGIEGEGAWKINLNNAELSPNWRKNAVRLPVENINKSTFTVVGSRSHSSKETDNYISDLEKTHKKLDLISIGSSLKLCLVAEGRADIYPRLGTTMEWDTAAGDAIARCAGCKVVRYDNGELLEYNKQNLQNPWFVVKR